MTPKSARTGKARRKAVLATKYRAKPCAIDGIRFASQKEGRRYQELRLLERAGKIRDLKLQPKIPLMVEGVNICTYIADFLYFDMDLKRFVWEDTKGFKTPMYKLKKKLVRALTGIEITET